MCGICGVAGPLGGPDIKEYIGGMLATLHHRGHYDGVWTGDGIGLGNRRLPIVDIENSPQPIFNEDQSLALVGNGMIYNYKELGRELRDKGHRFSTNGDLECILHLYEEMGPDLWLELRGMFAVAIYDTKKGELILARDPMGVKPLFYYHQGDTLAFASEIKALTTLPFVPTDLDPQALSDFLSLQFIPRPHTVYKQITEVPPAHYLIFKEGRIVNRQYWEIGPNGPEGRSIPQEETLELLRTSVRRRLIADVPVGVLLSGGLDSSVIAALAQKIQNGPVQTFAIVFREKTFDESSYARMVAAAIGTEHHELVLDQSIILDSMEEVSHYFDEPFCEGSAFPLYHICRYAKDHVTVILSGEGADEIFGGYETYVAQHLAGFYRPLPGIIKKTAGRLVQRLPVSDNKTSLDLKLRRFTDGVRYHPIKAHFWWRAAMNDRDKAQIIHPDFSRQVDRPSSAQLYEQVFNRFPEGDTINRIMAVDCRLHLVDDLLLRADRMSMAHTMELRVPFMDIDLVEHAFSIPSKRKIRGLDNKRPLRRAAMGLVPEKIRKRAKKGLNMPYQKWFKQRRWREILHDHLEPGALKKWGIFDVQGVRGLLDRHERGLENNAHALWVILNLALWLERHEG